MSEKKGISQRVVSLTGDPGAGKTLFCKLLLEEFGVPWLSISRELSSHCNTDTDFSMYSNLAPDEKVFDIVHTFIAEHVSQASAFTIDGFPRTINQAKALSLWSDSYLWDLKVYYLTYSHINVKKAWNCIRRRATCSVCGSITLQDLSDIPQLCAKCGVGTCIPRDTDFSVFEKRILASRSFLRELQKSDLIVEVQRVDPCHVQIVEQLARHYAMRLGYWKCME